MPDPLLYWSASRAATDLPADARLVGPVPTLPHQTFRLPSNAGQLILYSVGHGLVVSQFTLYADARKGRRPSFVRAAAPEHAEALVARFAAALTAQGLVVETGRFRSHMAVEIHNDGPVTIWLDTAELRGPT